MAHVMIELFSFFWEQSISSYLLSDWIFRLYVAFVISFYPFVEFPEGLFSYLSFELFSALNPSSLSLIVVPPTWAPVLPSGHPFIEELKDPSILNT